MKTKKSFIKIIFCFIAFQFFFLFSLNSQDTIYLRNPGFEDIPRKGGQTSAPIRGWHDCSLSMFPSESPPDIHPVPSNAWEVSMDPFEGNTYMGLVVRHNDTYESISQELSKSLEEGKCYSFSAILARSDRYISATSRSTQLENFTHPAILKIWGGDDMCKRGQLLGETIPVENSEWMIFDFNFSPVNNWTSITIEAYYSNGSLERYNGHIMVDDLSPIIEIDCK